MPKPKITNRADGSVDITANVSADRKAIVLHSNRNFEEVAEAAIEAVMAQNYATILGDAQKWYREKLESDPPTVDGTLSAWNKEAELIALFMADHGYENITQREAREAEEEAARIAAEEAAAAALAAAIATAEDDVTAAEDALNQ